MLPETLNDKPQHDPILPLDAVIFCWRDEQLLVLLEERRKDPFKGVLAVPGGYIHTDTDRTLPEGRDRILLDKVGFLPNYMEQLESVGSMDRDPRGWSVSIIYMCILKQDNPIFTDLPDHLKLVPVSAIRQGEVDLAFDHREIVGKAYQRLAMKTAYSSLPLMFMPKYFTMPMIMNIHKAIMGVTPNKMSLHKRYKQGHIIEPAHGMSLTMPGYRSADAYISTIVEPEMFSGLLGGGG